MRRIYIGDIQGCLAALDRLLVRLVLRPDDRVYCVGDLVNRGPDSLGVLRRLRAIGARSVLGNHDLNLLKLAGASPRQNVPVELEPVLQAADAAEHIDWLARQPVMLVDDDIVVVHAGLHPRWTDLNAVAAAVNRAVPEHLNGSSDERITFATKVRYCDAGGHRPAQDDPAPGQPFMPWDHWYRGPRTVVFGHWARRGLVTGARVRGLDTGCVYGRALTAWIAEEDRLVQVSGVGAA
jgi:bis(5'-nucleosyl)-tetraphosphatase (symmetrical)